MPVWRSSPLRPNRSWADSSWLVRGWHAGAEEQILPAWALASASAAGVEFAGVDRVESDSHRGWGCTLAWAAALLVVAPIGASGRLPFRWCAAA